LAERGGFEPPVQFPVRQFSLASGESGFSHANNDRPNIRKEYQRVLGKIFRELTNKKRLTDLLQTLYFILAERGGFEPPVQFPVRQFSLASGESGFSHSNNNRPNIRNKYQRVLGKIFRKLTNKKGLQTNCKPFNSFWRREGDSNPRYSFPYVSLANWWFQPLTHLSSTSRTFIYFPYLRLQRYQNF
jgi:hypothetical protein